MPPWSKTLEMRRQGEAGPEFAPTDVPREKRDDDGQRLERMTNAELVDLAIERGVDVDPKARKAELVAAIRNAGA